MKMKWLHHPALTLLVMAVLMAGLFAGCAEAKPGDAYDYESSLRWYETVENVVLDGKMDDAIWQQITPFRRTTSRTNRAEKYEALESRIVECNAEVYTAFGENGLFIYAKTDDPVVNTSVVSPLAKSAFEFYICSQDALTKWGNIFEFTISADNCLKLRVREHHPETGAETWLNRPYAGVKSRTTLEDQGYALECFIPWQTLNMDGKPEKLQMATALIRVLDPEDATNFLWECFDYNTASIALNNSATFPLFDEGGYIPLTDGENFQAVSSNIIDLSTDTGDKPYVTALNRSVVTTFLKMDPAADVYWESTVTLRDFNPNDDPRVGILLKGEDREDGSYDRVYLMLELEKAYEGEGYQIKHALMLPSSTSGNNWKDAQRYVLGSHIENESFKLAIMKKNGVFHFFVDDVLVASRSAVEDFAADTKVTCGITSWYTGAVFSDYTATTENLNAIFAKKRTTFVTDEKKWKLYFDLFHQGQGYVTTEESDAWMYHSIANFQGISASRFYAETDIRIDGSLVNGNGYAGFALTSGENRLYIMLAGTGKGLQYVEYHSMTRDNFAPTGAGRKVLQSWDTVKLGNKNKLGIYRDGNELTVLLNGQVMEKLDLSKLTYPIKGSTKIGLTGWKVKATFSGYSVKTGNGFAAPEYVEDRSGVTHGDFTMTLAKGQANVFAETALKVTDVLDGVYPRVGLRLTNHSDENLDFFVYYNKEKALQSWLAARLTDADGADVGNAQYFAIDSEVADFASEGIRLSIAKKDGLVYFYANDVLLGAKAFDGFGAEEPVTVSLYSKFTETDFMDYRATADVTVAMAEKQNGFVADDRRTSDCFDVLHYADAEDPRITIHETCAYAESSVIHFNGVYSDKIYAKTTLALNNAANAYAGMVLTDEAGNRFYVMTYGTSGGITYLEYFTVLGDDFAGRTSVYDSITVSGGNACALTLDKNAETLLVYVDDTLVKTITLPQELAGQTQVGLSAWKGVEAVYTDYSVLAGEAYPVPEEPEFVGDVSDLENSNHDYPLHEATAELFAQTTVQVADVATGVSPRAGLRLTNAAGDHVDFFVYFTGKKAQNWLIAVPVNGENADAGVKQYYGIDSAVGSISGSGIQLAVAKKGGELYFYANDVLLGVKTYAGFGAEDAVVASLYSKYTQSNFTDYSVTADVNAAMAAKQADFIADGNRASDCFDVLNYAHSAKPQIVLNETCSNAESSIIHWNGIFAERLFAETNIALNNTSNAYAGIVLSDEENNRFYVMTYGNADGITYMEYFTVIGDDYSGRTSVYDTISVAGGNQCKLAVYKEGGDLLVYVDGQLVKTLALPAALAGKTKVGLSGWKSVKAVFTDYRVGGIYVTDVKKGTDLHELSQESGDFYAETLLRINAPTTGVYSRVGLRLASGDKTWDCVVYFSNKGGLEPYILLVDQSETKQYSQDYSSLLPGKQMPLTLRLGVKREGEKLSVYLNGILLKDYYAPDSTQFSGFAAEDAVTVSLYSKLTDAVFADYFVESLF